MTRQRYGFFFIHGKKVGPGDRIWNDGVEKRLTVLCVEGYDAKNGGVGAIYCSSARYYKKIITKKY